MCVNFGIIVAVVVDRLVFGMFDNGYIFAVGGGVVLCYVFVILTMLLLNCFC